MSKSTRRLSKQHRKEIREAKKMAAFTSAIKLIERLNGIVSTEIQETQDQKVVRELMKISNEQMRDSLIPSQRRYDVQVCPYLLQEPTTGKNEAALLITKSEPLCYLGDIPIYR